MRADQPLIIYCSPLPISAIYATLKLIHDGYMTTIERPFQLVFNSIMIKIQAEIRRENGKCGIKQETRVLCSNQVQMTFDLQFIIALKKIED